MSDTGYTTQDVHALGIDQLLEEALQSAYDSGYYAATGRGDLLYLSLGQVAIDRRNECFAELRRRLERANGSPPACSACHSAFQPGEPQRQGDDGRPLCAECYAARYGERDREDERYRLGDIQFDQDRGN